MQNGGTAEVLYSNLLLTVLRVGSYITVCSYLHRLGYLFMTTKRGSNGKKRSDGTARVRCPVALVLSGERGRVRRVGEGRIRPFPGQAQPALACTPLQQHDANYTHILANFFYQSLSEEVVLAK